MRNLAAPAWLFAVGLLAVSPTALVAQNDTGQPVGQEDNTSYGTTAAEFLLLGAGARGAALGGSFAAIATDAPAGYRALARLRAAALKAEAGDRAAALALWDGIARDGAVEPLYRSLATLMWGLHSLDGGDPGPGDQLHALLGQPAGQPPTRGGAQPGPVRHVLAGHLHHLDPARARPRRRHRPCRARPRSSGRSAPGAPRAAAGTG